MFPENACSSDVDRVTALCVRQRIQVGQLMQPCSQAHFNHLYTVSWWLMKLNQTAGYNLEAYLRQKARKGIQWHKWGQSLWTRLPWNAAFILQNQMGCIRHNIGLFGNRLEKWVFSWEICWNNEMFDSWARIQGSMELAIHGVIGKSHSSSVKWSFSLLNSLRNWGSGSGFCWYAMWRIVPKVSGLSFPVRVLSFAIG